VPFINSLLKKIRLWLDAPKEEDIDPSELLDSLYRWKEATLSDENLSEYEKQDTVEFADKAIVDVWKMINNID
jgi:hypothetical protein